MDVYEAVTSRRAVRGFKDEPVSREVLERVLSAAAWSPSGSNIQPWNTYVLIGAPLAELKTRAVERVCHGDPWDERQYEMYPPALKSPYGERRSAFGKERYSALGIAREDWEARQRAAIGNWNCFGAPAALFCYIDRVKIPRRLHARRTTGFARGLRNRKNRIPRRFLIRRWGRHRTRRFRRLPDDASFQGL